MKASISELIAEKIGAMPASERKAAQTLIANYPLIGLRTVAEFSTQAGVSSPTILRFVARLGFQSYPEFQNALQEELAAQVQSPWNRATAIQPPKAGAAFPLMEAAIENIRETFQHLSAQQLDDVTDAISYNRARVYLLGGRFTDPIARYMAAHLKITRPGVTHLAGQESHWRDQLIDMGKKDVLVIFDIRRYQDSLARFAEKAQARGVDIVLITDQWLSPIARFARHVIAGRTAVPSPWDSSATLFLVAETLIAEVTRKLEKSSANRIRDMEQLRDK
ncbi:MurR/RpiR family transcriptional regulator [Phyllobacterium endophyticum]|uniref:RpiR family transcriptional regulator n=1 Tax=Phyllobacterium endophyticum TaxID=1149773 RepID=A0A2P7AL88_9HYPH|nr:MurR/RpiR family transcriptional regulator [Phyllobacterium endophyticum]PSH54954.1 RpiR family transcriptional regulator [Phyllobacterium endophyticum]TXR46982.1 MurR/RpiR family transcriptional regulator [Phyllobacterium endophyticum]TYR43410.1 MurR/RpiR family transcriptional regulator [Phyllobacterium endophyticum]